MNPVQEGGYAGEDGGLGVLVAAAGGAVADHTMEPPRPICEAAQRATRVPLTRQSTYQHQAQMEGSLHTIQYNSERH